MTDQALRRADELLTELVELVETARVLPMSSSCVLPRERVLDLLDALRETMPPEMNEARRTLAQRDALLGEARSVVERARHDAEAASAAVLATAHTRAAQLMDEAEVAAAATLERTREEQQRLLSETEIVASARTRADAVLSEAAAVRGQADEDASAVLEHARREAEAARAHAHREAAAVRARADEDAVAVQEYSARLAADAEEYADATLADLVETLQRAVAQAEHGRLALARRGESRRPVAASRPPDEPSPAGRDSATPDALS